MSGELQFCNGTGSITVNANELTWVIEPDMLQLKPVTFRILKDIFGSGLIPNFLIFFGKFSERLKINVQFPTDEEWKAFRKWVKNTAYFKNGTACSYVQWGSSGEPFYGKWENTVKNGASNGSYGRGFFGTINVDRKFPSGVWEGSIDWWFGVEVKL